MPPSPGFARFPVMPDPAPAPPRPPASGLGCLLGLVAWCGIGLAPAPAAATGVGGYDVDYTGYSHGFVVLKLSGTLHLSPDGYDAHVMFHAAGMAGFLVRMDNDSHATGTWQGAQAAPTLFEGTGHLHGTKRLTRITYRQGNPVIKALSPPVEQERTAVPIADAAGTIDTLSAVAALIRQVGQTGTCDGAARTFDGRRLATQTVHGAGHEVLARTARSSFAGDALRCDFEGVQLGGYIRDENEADLKKPRRGTAWVADTLPGAPPVPVRVAFENKLLGQVTLYLTGATASR